MEEAEELLLLSLREAGCTLAEETASLGDISSADLIALTGQCLNKIRASSREEGDNEAYPETNAAMDSVKKFRLCQELTKALESLGYRGTLGFDMFLYPERRTIRDILSFLLEKVPKSERAPSAPTRAATDAVTIARRLLHELVPRKGKDSVTTGQTTSEFYSFQTDEECISEFVKNNMAFHCLRHSALSNRVCNVLEICALDCFYSPRIGEKDEEIESALQAAKDNIEQSRQKHLDDQMAKSPLTALPFQDPSKFSSSTSLFQATAYLGFDSAGVDSQSSPLTSKVEEKTALSEEDGKSESKNNQADAPVVKPETPEERNARIEAEWQNEITTLSKDAESIARETKSLAAAVEEISSECERLQSEISSLNDDLTLLKKEREIRQKAVEFVGDGSFQDKTLELDELLSAADQRMEVLQQEWERVSQELESSTDALKEAQAKVRNAAEKRVNTIKNLKEEIQELQAKIKVKEEHGDEQKKQLESTTKSVSRMVYVSRIQDITKNIKKQDEDIFKILTDTKDVQRNINPLMETLKRVYAVTDEMVFRDAKQNDISKDAYRHLSKIHQSFEGIAKISTEMGKTAFSIRAVEKKLQSVKHTSMDQITKDLKSVKKENNEMIRKLKSMS